MSKNSKLRHNKKMTAIKKRESKKYQERKFKSSNQILFHILDTNLFRKACKSKNGAFIINLNASLSRNIYLKNSEITAFKLTPFGLLEFLGIVPPHPPSIEIPDDILCTENSRAISDYIITSAKYFYSTCDELKLHNLNAKCTEQEAYVEYEAMPLFDICVKNILKQPNIEEVIAGFLAFDYLYKYRFNAVLEKIMLQYLSVHFFMDDIFSSSLSKFRLSKRVWDKIREDLIKKYKNNEDKLKVIEIYTKSMKIKNQRDFLDGDLVHSIAYGHEYNGQRCRVVALTCDDAFNVCDRVVLHRLVGDVIYDNCDKNVKALFEKMAKHKGGFVVTCNDDGHFTKTLDISQLPKPLDSKKLEILATQNQ
jgi:hypothetical protein